MMNLRHSTIGTHHLDSLSCEVFWQTLFIAVPEELLFRGIIQNLLEKEIGRPGLALGVAAVIFGAAHLNNGPSPDWRYFLLATLAGMVYGRAYARTRNLMAPALVHTLVDVAWRGFFR